MNDLNNTIEYKVKSLENWAREQSISFYKLDNVVSMIKLGSRGERKESDPMQFPDFYYPDSGAKAWHHADDYAWTGILEKAFPEIKKEALSIFSKNLMSEHPQNEDLANEGTWKTFFFYKNGIKYPDNMALCPYTSNVIDSIPGTSRAGRVYFSAMTQGTHVKAHCGPHNFKLRCHLGLVTSPKAVIRVGEETRYWEDGRCIVFDDSFEHEVWNKSHLTRIVLILDVWNPCLTEEEIMALMHIGIPSA